MGAFPAAPQSYVSRAMSRVDGVQRAVKMGESRGERGLLRVSPAFSVALTEIRQRSGRRRSSATGVIASVGGSESARGWLSGSP